MFFIANDIEIFPWEGQILLRERLFFVGNVIEIFSWEGHILLLKYYIYCLSFQNLFLAEGGLVPENSTCPFFLLDIQVTFNTDNSNNMILIFISPYANLKVTRLVQFIGDLDIPPITDHVIVEFNGILLISVERVIKYPRRDGILYFMKQFDENCEHSKGGTSDKSATNKNLSHISPVG